MASDLIGILNGSLAVPYCHISDKIPSAFEEFCGGPIWDWDLSWHSAPPDVTPCFQHTILVGLPCGFLWFALPIYLRWLNWTKRKPLPCSRLTLVKVALSLSLALLACINIVKYAPRDGSAIATHIRPLSAAILAATLLISSILQVHHVRRGNVTSGVLSAFWFLLAVAGGIRVYSQVLKMRNGDNEFSPFLNYGIICLSLALSCIAEKRPNKNDCPQDDVSFISRITFWWIKDFLVTGYTKPLKKEDLWNMRESDKASSLAPIFDEAWDQELRRCQWNTKTNRSVKCEEEDYNNNDSCSKAGDSPLSSRGEKEPSLIWALLKVHWPALVWYISLRMVHDILNVTDPIIQSQLITFVELDAKEKQKYQWKGYLYATLLFLVYFVNIYLVQHWIMCMCKLSMQTCRTLMCSIYKKALALSMDARRGTTVGEIVNHMSVDARRVAEGARALWLIWSIPFQLVVSLYMLYGQLGASVFAGLIVIVLMVPLNASLVTFMKALEVKKMELKDKRIKLMNEVLNGIKVLKLYAWEMSFMEKVRLLRDTELDNLLMYNYYRGWTGLFYTMMSFMVLLITLTVYVLAGNTLSASKAFVSLSLMGTLQWTVNTLPHMSSIWATATVSLQRLRKFLLHDERDDLNVQRSEICENGNAVEVRNGSFSWNKTGVSVLKNINIEISPGSMVAIVGQVGAGKSSLISAILGDMEKQSGQVGVKGRVAYVSQQAWIQSATLRNNILFCSPFDENRYNTTLDVCALRPDLAVLAAGDKTEIGEKGINLSGGQKQRVSVARAVYSEADVYLFDDPLSAVDAHVGKHIFDTCLGPNGILCNKTRLLVTHSVHFLPHMDKILVVSDGTISEAGTYEELVARNGPFSEFLKTHLGTDSETAMMPSSSDIEDTNVYRPVDGGPLSRSTSRNDDDKDTPRDAESDGKLVEDEDNETGTVQWSVIWQYIDAVGLGNIILIVGAFLVNQVTDITSSLWLAKWTSDPVFNGTLSANDSEFIYSRNMYLGVYGGIGVMKGIVTMFTSLFAATAMTKASKTLHNNLLGSILRAPMSFFDTTPTGRILNRFSKDVESIDSGIFGTIQHAVHCLLVLISSGLIVTVFTSPMLSCLFLPLLGLHYVLQRFYVPTSRQLSRLESSASSLIFSKFSETLAGVSTIRAYQMDNTFHKHSQELIDHDLRCVYYQRNIERWLECQMDLLRAVALFATVLYAVSQDQTGAVMGITITYVIHMGNVLQGLVYTASHVEDHMISLGRIVEYSNTIPEAEWIKETPKPTENWPHEGAVKFTNYATRYRAGLDLVVKDISLNILPGEKVGIVGRTGAGKSSLTMGLFRIIESAAGSIHIDGVPIHDLGLHQLRSRLTILPQDPVLFSGSLKMNLDPFSEHTEGELWHALETAHLKTFVKGLTEDLEYECGEGGQNLSVGQRQLVCLARTLLRKTKVLVLDEATANVDLDTDDLIQKTIRTEFASCTVLTIAHRLKTVMDNDRILVLDQGHIAEFASPASLLQDKNGIFYSMAKESGIVTSGS